MLCRELYLTLLFVCVSALERVFCLFSKMAVHRLENFRDNIQTRDVFLKDLDLHTAHSCINLNIQNYQISAIIYFNVKFIR